MELHFKIFIINETKQILTHIIRYLYCQCICMQKKWQHQVEINRMDEYALKCK